MSNDFNEMILVAVTPFSGTTTPDKNGKMPVMLQCLAGKMPNRNVMAGTVAERGGFEIGRTYLTQVRKRGEDLEFGDDFTFTKIREITSGVDIVQTQKELGHPQIIIVERPEGFEDKYERKGDAVESIQTKREKEGLYKRTIPSTTSRHETAREIKDGTSTKSDAPVNLGGNDEHNAGDKPQRNRTLNQ